MLYGKTVANVPSLIILILSRPYPGISWYFFRPNRTMSESAGTLTAVQQLLQMFSGVNTLLPVNENPQDLFFYPSLIYYI